MKKCERKNSANSSGQLFIVAALTIAIIISSTTIYFHELNEKSNSVHHYPVIDAVLALKQSAKNTVISSLSNISNGGSKSNLEVNLNNLARILKNLAKAGMCHSSFTLINDSKYDCGTYLSWDKDGIGISSACANFTLRITGVTTNMIVDYAVNTTTMITINGSYTRLDGEEKLVNLTCQVFNGEEPALTKSISLFYRNVTDWIPVNSSNNLSIIDYGNGTYFLSFTADITTDVEVSMRVFDLRDIFVQANTTCSEF